MPHTMVSMQDFHLSWPGGAVTLTDPKTIEDALNDLDHKFAVHRRSVLVGIDSDFASLDVGLGILHCAVYLEGAAEEGFLSVGPQDSDEELPFEYAAGEVTHVPARALISQSEVIAVAMEFVKTAERPETISWQVL